MPNNLPTNLRRHTAHQENTYTHKVNMPVGYPMPTTITALVRKNRKTIPDIGASCVITGQSWTFTYTPDKLRKISGLYDHYFAFDGVEKFGGQLDVVIGYGETEPAESTYELVEGEETFISVDGIEFIQSLNGIMGSEQKYTLDQVRALNNPVESVFNLGDSIAVYNTEDTTSLDNGTTILVDASGRRYKIMSVISVLSQVLKTLKIFQNES